MFNALDDVTLKRCVVKESMLLFNRIILDKSRSTSFVSWSFVKPLVSNCNLKICPQTYMNYKQIVDIKVMMQHLSCVDLLFGEVVFTRQLDLESNNTSCITLLNEAWSYLFYSGMEKTANIYQCLFPRANEYCADRYYLLGTLLY